MAISATSKFRRIMRNKNALARYLAIDTPLTGPKKFPNATELRRIIERTTGIYMSKSMIQKDIYNMIHDKGLGYLAPIKYCDDRKGYYYTDPEFTIDINALIERIKILKSTLQIS